MRILGIIALFVIAIGVAASYAPPPRSSSITTGAISKPSSSSSSSTRGCTAEKYQKDKARIELAFNVGAVRNDPAGGVSLLVKDAFWNGLDYVAKQDFAEAFSCAVAGEGKVLGSGTFRSARTGKVLGELRWGKLDAP